jgi:UDP-2-acetamido-3-amino-2,3-dideoxy-glucuronate N-acetyltransferase
MVFTNVINPRSFIERKDEYRRTLIRRGASIGANATIVCGVTLGRYCVVGAGAVVTRDVPEYAVIYGNPARVRSWVCYCGIGLQLGGDDGETRQAACSACGRRYGRAGRNVTEA